MGGKSESVTSFWEASHLHPNKGLSEMKLKALIKLDEHDRLGMDSELWDMGRDIVVDEYREPGKHSRLLKLEEVEVALMKENVRF